MNKTGQSIQNKVREWSGVIAGILFLLAGLIVVFPADNLFGTILTMYAVVFTVIQVRHVLHETDENKQKGEAEDTVAFLAPNDVETKMIKLKKLYEKKLITETEYQQKKTELLKRL